MEEHGRMYFPKYFFKGIWTFFSCWMDISPCPAHTSKLFIPSRMGSTEYGILQTTFFLKYSRDCVSESAGKRFGGEKSGEIWKLLCMLLLHSSRDEGPYPEVQVLHPKLGSKYPYEYVEKQLHPPSFPTKEYVA